MTNKEIQQKLASIREEQQKLLQHLAEITAQQKEHKDQLTDHQARLLELEALRTESDIRFNNKLEALLEKQADHEIKMQRWAEEEDIRAKKDRIQAKKDRIQAKKWQHQMNAFEKQADLDRREIRTAIEALISNSEDLRNICKQLTTAVIGINKRVKRLEDNK